MYAGESSYQHIQHPPTAAPRNRSDYKKVKQMPNGSFVSEVMNSDVVNNDGGLLGGGGCGVVHLRERRGGEVRGGGQEPPRPPERSSSRHSTGSPSIGM